MMLPAMNMLGWLEQRNFVKSAHPVAEFEGQTEDLCTLLEMVAEDRGWGCFSNGGEVMDDVENAVVPEEDGIRFVYVLSADYDLRKSLALTVTGHVSQTSEGHPDMFVVSDVQKTKLPSYYSEA